MTKQVSLEVPGARRIGAALRTQLGVERPYAKLGEVEQKNTASARRKVVGQMTAAYQFGYDIGVEFAMQLPWRGFLDFALADWDLDAWRSGFDDRDYEIVDRESGSWDDEAATLAWDDIMEIVTEMKDPLPVSDDGLPIGLPREGFVDAIRGVWEGHLKTLMTTAMRRRPRLVTHQRTNHEFE